MQTIVKITAFIIIIASVGVCGMALSDTGKVCLFSEISGVITLDGKPVANAKLIRTANHGKDITDETTTDANGHFTMPAIFSRTLTGILPMEFVDKQYIIVQHNGKEYKIWDGVKRSMDINAEARGKPLVVQCDLNQPVDHISVDGSIYFTMCTWDVVPDAPIDTKRGFFDQDS